MSVAPYNVPVFKSTLVSAERVTSPKSWPLVEYVGVASTQILLENTTAAVDEDTSTSPVTANQLVSPLPSKSGRPLPPKSLSPMLDW